MKNTVTVGIANEGRRNFNVDEMSNWEPKKITYSGTSVFFKVEDTFYSMDRTDFEEIFKPNTYKLKK